mmetsp:Transcript_48593/g.89530  ORF Transcript_48593/g.89530 Transcript_48593/m.89530 type:complete len:473 (-) Transcript_48593:47-1465(-)
MPELVELKEFCEACYQGDVNLLAEFLDASDAGKGFFGDINEHCTDFTALHYAAINGQTEVVQRLLTARADPHVRSRVPKGTDPADGKTALDLADEWGWEDIVGLLEDAKKSAPRGQYLGCGRLNNAKLYEAPLDDSGLTQERVKVLQDRLRGFQLPASPTETPLQRPALFFPGEGSQMLSMFHGADASPASWLLKSAEELTGTSLTALCKSGTLAGLSAVSVLPVAVYVSDCLALAKLQGQDAEAINSPLGVSGLGFGEVAALVGAGVCSMEDGLRLAAALSAALGEAFKSQPSQCMLTVAGLRLGKLQDLCTTVAKAGTAETVCDVAQVLFPKGHTCAGQRTSIEKLQKMAQDSGALQTKLLDNMCALNTKLMQPVAAKLDQVFQELASSQKLQPPKCVMFMNTGHVVYPGSNPRTVVRYFMKALTSPMQWESCLRGMAGLSASKYFEVGPSNQIKSMMKRVDAEAYERFQ